MKLYQVVKKYGLDRVKKVVNTMDASIPLSIRKNIEEAYKESDDWEKKILNYSAVSIAYFFLMILPTLRKVLENKKMNLNLRPWDYENLCTYMLESIEPDNEYVQESKSFCKRYYSKKEY